MAPRALAVGLAIAGCLGCGQERAAAPDPDEGPDAVRAAGPAYGGPLTVARIERAAGEAAPHRRWPVALARVLAGVGPPTRVDGDVHGWYLLDGGRCHFLEVTRDGAAGEVSSTRQGAADPQDGSYYALCGAGEPDRAPATPGR